MFTDARNEALDRSLSQLQLLSNTHSETVWKFVSDMRKDPYSTAMTAFSKITDKLVYRFVFFLSKNSWARMQLYCKDKLDPPFEAPSRSTTPRRTGSMPRVC